MILEKYWHSVTLEKDYCNGCTHCLDRCPTQAIRVVNGKAQIINERCIDCGECLKVCPFHAKGAETDELEIIKNYKYKIALPAISIYGQFPKSYDMNRVFNGLIEIGFDTVFDTAYAADILTEYEKEKIKKNPDKAIISTYCPAITRLIQIRYPSLLEQISRLESPMEVAARLARKEAVEKLGLKAEDIGVFYITQCPAKITSIKHPLGIDQSAIDGAISLEAIYTKIIKIYDDITTDKYLQKASGNGIGWGRVGGQSFSMGIENYIAVDGIEEVIKVLDNIELGKLRETDFFEFYACVTGCVGGPLNVENPFIAKNRVRKRAKKMGEGVELDLDVQLDPELLEWNKDIEAHPILKLDTDIRKALQKMAKIEEYFQSLPGINCGACGAPTCRALAEDVVMGKAEIEDCVLLKVRNEK